MMENKIIASNVSPRNNNSIESDRLLKLAKHLSKGQLYERPTGSSALYSLSVHQNGSVIRYYDFPFYECVHLFPEWVFSPAGFPVLAGISQASVIDSALDFFDLGIYGFQHLFCPNSQFPATFGGRTLERNASTRDIAYNIKRFVEVRKNKLIKIAA